MLQLHLGWFLGRFFSWRLRWLGFLVTTSSQDEYANEQQQ
jgi:hypothetical protein